MKAISKAILFLLLLISLFYFSNLYAFDYVISVTQHKPANPPPPIPQRGIPFTDPDFGTTIVRLTDARTDPGGIGAYPQISLRYAKFSPENADETRALLRTRGGTNWALYNVDRNSPTKYRFIKPITIPEAPNIAEPRWDGADPNIFYFPYEMKFCAYDIRTDKWTVIRDFSVDFLDKKYIFNDDEGDSSADSRYWVWFLAYWQGGELLKRGIFSWDKQANKILGVLNVKDHIARHGGGNWVSFTDTGKKIVIGSDYGQFKTCSYNPDFTNMVHLADYAGHSDTAIDADGNEVLFGFDFAGDSQSMVRLSDGKTTKLLTRPWPNPRDWTGVSYGHSSGAHSVSKPGWGLYSSYSSGPVLNGSKFDAYLIYLMELKDVGHQTLYGYDPNKVPKVWQIAHHYSSGCYEGQPHAVMNRKGTRIYFTSCWKIERTDCDYKNDAFDTYIIELPPNWYNKTQ